MKRLTSIGVTLAAFVHFVCNFIGHRFDYIRQSITGGWTTIRGRVFLTDKLLAEHLAGDVIVGTGCRRYKEAWTDNSSLLLTPYCVVDLDHKGDHGNLATRAAGERDLLERYDRVVAALGMPGHLFRSSGSYGLHLYYFLDRLVPLSALRTADGSDGALVRLLRQQGLHEAAARLELYPGGDSIRYGPQRRLRAPFGHDCRLLDPLTFEPLTGRTGAENLAYSLRLFDNGDIESVNAELLLRRAAALGSAEPPAARPKSSAKPASATSSRSSGKTPADYAPFVDRLLTVGLVRPGERNEAASALAFHYRFRRRISAPAAKQELLTWLDARHNGQSDTYNRSPERARREAAAVVDRVYRGKDPRHWGPLPDLTEFEARTLLNTLSRESEICDRQTGELPDRYKLEQFGFELLRHAKQFVLTAVAELGVNRIRHVWPDQTRLEFIVPVPLKLREGRLRSGTGFMKGIGRDYRTKLWAALRNAGVFTLVQAASKQARRAASYRVSLDFGALSRGCESFATLDAAILVCLTPDAIRSRYTRYRRELIAGAGQAPSTEVSLEAAQIAAILRQGRAASNAAEEVDRAA